MVERKTPTLLAILGLWIMGAACAPSGSQHAKADDAGAKAVPESAKGAKLVPSANTTAILVDKKTNSLELCEYVDGAYKVLKTFHATLGQVKGDKEDEGDLKTPEGIYTFKS